MEQVKLNIVSNGNLYKNAEVTGIINNIIYPDKNTRSTITKIKIYCPNVKRTYNGVFDFYCPLKQGDIIYTSCVIGEDETLYINKPPFVQPPIDRDSVIQCFIRALKEGYGRVIKIYKIISKIAGGDDQVIGFLSEIGQTFYDTQNYEILTMFNGIDSDIIKKLLIWWHKERNLRRLYLFGLTKKEINACRMTCDEIYWKCMENPYTIPAIPLDKCDGILDRLNKKPDNNDRVRGSIMRILWKNLVESGWTGTPTKFLIKQFPGIKEHVETLKNNYGMIAELETAYLQFPHKVELFTTNYLIRKQSENLITYDMPLDQSITLENGDIIERLGAHFTKELSEDQQKAIQGALDHPISIITGGAGVGKCVQIGTKILMFDGTIKKIEEIKEGESVMGPDSKPRKVISKCIGIDNMYEVIPSKGRSYTFNEPHILTLKGFDPYIKYRSNRSKNYIVYQSIRGIRKRKSFNTGEEAEKFINSLQEDIFDIPINEFMLRSKDEQRDSYLFHVGVNYPEKYLPMDPYLIGYWLGSGDNAAPEITTNDPEIFNEYYHILDSYNMILSKTKHPMKFYIRGKDADHHCNNKFLNVLRNLDMLDNKHIPDIYKINSRENRLKLLAGLIDSDGHKDKDGYIEITQKNKQLADDIEYLAFSLGFMVTRIECEKSCIYKGIYQRMNIFGEGLEEIPVILERKKSQPREINKRENCQRFEIKQKGKGIYCGFELDGDGRFLLGDFLVTHNTTCLGQIIHNLELRGITYAVCSFTGKAVARIREVTKKRNPSTIHRLISNTRKNQMDKRSTQFEKDIPLSEYDHVIIDEASMTTMELFYDFLQAYPNIKKLTLIGDVNQLSPIGWGNLFKEILKSETIPTYKLTTNYRVYTSDGDRDGIILNANAIVSHDPMFPFEFIPTNNFSIIEGPIERVYDIVRGCFAGGVKPDQLVIISPFNRYLDVLNKTFQDIYNIGARSIIDSRGIKWMIGDRVMLTENDQEIGVFNGESGTIRDISNNAILVDFSSSGCHEFLFEPTHEKRYNYYQGTSTSYNYRGNKTDNIMDGDEGDIDDERTVKRLCHSYALTVDKSQGSEWDFVIFYIPEFNTGSFINKNRVYTAITRTKRCCWCVVNDTDSFNISSVKLPPYRCDNLSRRLSNKLPNLKPFKIPSPLLAQEMVEGTIPIEYCDTGFDSDDFE